MQSKLFAALVGATAITAVGTAQAADMVNMPAHGHASQASTININTENPAAVWSSATVHRAAGDVGIQSIAANTSVTAEAPAGAPGARVNMNINELISGPTSANAYVGHAGGAVTGSAVAQGGYAGAYLPAGAPYSANVNQTMTSASPVSASFHAGSVGSANIGAVAQGLTVVVGPAGAPALAPK